MPKKKKIPTIHLPPGSPLGEALKKMVLHKRFKESYWRGEITLKELNALLKENGIDKQYEPTFAL